MRTLIRRQSRLLLPDGKAIWQYRDLLTLLVRRDFLAKYAQTWMGPAWFLLQPVVTSLLFLVVFSKGLRVDTLNVPPVLFYFSGLCLWGYLSQTLVSVSLSLVAHAEMLKRVHFPRILLPVSACVSGLVAFGIQLAALGFFYAYYVGVEGSSVRPSAELALLPLLVLVLISLALGMGLWVAALSVRYRDFHHLLQFGLGLWVYATPIAYPLSAVPESVRWVIGLNPLTPWVELFRMALFGQGSVDSFQLAFSFSFAVLVLISGCLVFESVQADFVDSV